MWFAPVPWITSVQVISNIHYYASDKNCDLRGSAGRICRLLVVWKGVEIVEFWNLCNGFVGNLFEIAIHDRRLVRVRLRGLLRSRLEGHRLVHNARAEVFTNADAIVVC